MARHLYSMQVLVFAFFGCNIIKCIRMAAAANGNEVYHFALIGHSRQNPWFYVVFEGCDARSKSLSVGGRNVTCHYYGTEEEDGEQQARLIEELVSENHSPKFDGISISVIDTKAAAKAIQIALDAGVAVITYDSDAPESSRQAYVGTNNIKFGVELGKLLLQLDPEGGKYGVLSADAANVMLRVDGVNEYLQKSPWSPVADSPKSCKDRVDVALEVMWEFAANPEIKAIIAVGGWPMFDPEGWKNFVDGNRQLMLISGDSLDQQLELINKGYANALVGQLPYNMGEMSADVLMQIIDGTFDESGNIIFGTEFLEILLFPLILPPVEMDNNYLGALVWMGYIFFGAIMFLSIGFCVWTYLNRADRVVVASQPLFLYMVCFGTSILASTMIPLTFDDEQYSQQANDRACMSIPWLASIGFTTTFAALFSKLRRVNRIFHNPNKFRRVVVHAKDVLRPYGVLMCCNLIVLITWTVVSPLTYVRHEGAGTDGWNRVVYTYGICESVGTVLHGGIYIIFLGLINIGVLVLANYQAYAARNVSTEFSESRYISIIMASMMQAFIVGIPIVFLIREDPVPYFVVFTLLLLITCLSVLLLMFMPKVAILRKKKMADARSNNNSNVVPSSEQRSYEDREAGLRVRVHKERIDSFALSSRRGLVHISGANNVASVVSVTKNSQLKPTVGLTSEFSDTRNCQQNSTVSSFLEEASLRAGTNIENSCVLSQENSNILSQGSSQVLSQESSCMLSQEIGDLKPIAEEHSQKS